MLIIRFLIVAAAVAMPTMQARGEMLGRVSSESQSFQLQEGFLGAIMPSSPTFNEQYGSPAPGGGMMGLSASMTKDVYIIPSITLSGTYDNNVYNAPKTPGLKREDYITTLAPQLQVQRLGSLVKLNFGIGATASHYAVNQGLSYVGSNATTTLNVTQLARQWIPNIKSLQVTDSFSFSPIPPSFLTGDTQVSQALDTSGTPSVADQYTRGLQAFRVNTYTNMAGINGVYPVTSLVDFRGSYTYSIIKFGTPFVAGSGGDFLNSTNHNISAGPTMQITTRDAISLSGVFQQTDYGQNGYHSFGGTLGWSSQLGSQLRSNIMAGATSTQTQSTNGTVAAAQSDVNYIGGASLIYTRGATVASLNYSAGVFPSYFVQTGPLLSNVVSVTVWHRATSQLSFSVSANYSHNAPLNSSSGSVPTGTSLAFQSVSGSAGISYLINKNLAMSLSETFGWFKGAGQGAFGAAGGGGIGDEFTRNAITISLTTFGLY